MNLTIATRTCKRRLACVSRPALWLAVFALFELSAFSCGPDFPTAVFVMSDGPGFDYAAYAAGHLGVPQSAYRTRNLMVAYDWLSGRPLSAAEQKLATAVDASFHTGAGPYEPISPPPNPVKDWVDARDVVIPPSYPTNADKTNSTANTSPSATQRAVPNDAYQSFDNCLSDAYANAARTLKARVASYGVKSPEVVEWVRGQNAVFSNCDGSGTLPAPVTTGSLWLRQDRAYQIAAAHFYALDYTGALATFRAIAADTASPWSALARYLEARTLIRQTSMANSVDPTSPDASKLNAGLTTARTELLAMRSEPRMATLRGAIDDLLDYINIRIQPEQQAVVLAARLHSAHPRNFGQALIDLSWARAFAYGDDDYPLFDASHRTPGELQKIRAAARTANNHDGADILDWMDSINVPSTGQRVDPLPHWRATHTTPWLLAAMMRAQPGDPAAPELLASAEKIAPDDPAYIALAYHRLRLSPGNAATHQQILALLPSIQKSANISTVNLFTDLDAETAPSLEAWLAAAPHQLAAETSWDDEVAPDAEVSPCRTKITGPNRLLFDTDSAIALNTEFPLELLAKAADDSTLPENLRYQIAQATWARAVMLDRPEVAARMTPLLVHCAAAWKPVIDAYDQSKTEDDRHANGLLALMRFASTEPSVREGEERRNGFATFDEFRQNWWCSTIPGPGDSVDTYFKPQDPNNYQIAAPVNDHPTVPAPPPPLFLAAADRTSAATELATLRKIPSASDYFAAQALAWFKAHPKDPRTSDIVGEANQVLRNSCRNDGTPKLAKALFDVLHQSFPQSKWTQKYKTWE